MAGCSGAGEVTCTEEFNGTAWSVVNPTINNSRRHGAAGSQVAAIAFGGQTPAGGIVGCTELYNQNGTQTVTLDVQALSQQFSRFKNICGVGY